MQENIYSLPPSGCICPGSNLTFECNIKGPGATVWKGSFINDCSGSRDVTLTHNDRFTQHQTCNDGAITIKALGADDANYTSQLIINLTMISLSNGSMITCAHYINNDERDVNKWTIIGMAHAIYNVMMMIIVLMYYNSTIIDTTSLTLCLFNSTIHVMHNTYTLINPLSPCPIILLSFMTVYTAITMIVSR